MNIIENKRQEKITKRWIYNFEKAKEETMKSIDKNKEPAKWNLYVNSLSGQIDDLKLQLKTYYRTPKYIKSRIWKWIKNIIDPHGTFWDPETVRKVTGQHNEIVKTMRAKWRRNLDNLRLLKHENTQLHHLCDKLIADGKLTLDEMRSMVNSRKEAKEILFGKIKYDKDYAPNETNLSTKQGDDKNGI